mmetsp:Transcript_18255/g.29996  ORF Transcript_18255/g.29996 Transcript_18255/m.29996 type:complete len:284 (+) Transcript_18255:153-1004(+)|eukprot:CAMPEP_0184643712 /NCGR_PEP_ID=MMETSP0308-20130426/536_1 /TAXON_ID=38269 /ORGANISM="Gloeochaete witrockiana, Strain SAG 46.84" /LENGTH=283 /DNA_ID=CAMNT_0027071823 /DNA_START=129 /DNA_END=980 /DNA_ORIENTATION=+
MTSPIPISSVPLSRSRIDLRDRTNSGDWTDLHLGETSSRRNSLSGTPLLAASLPKDGATWDDLEAAIQASLQDRELDPSYTIAKSRVSERASEFGLELVLGTDSTGHCQFDSIAYLLRKYDEGDSVTHQTVRRKCSEWLLHNPDYRVHTDEANPPTIREWFEGSHLEIYHFKGWEEYCLAMHDPYRKPPLWGDSFTLLAAAEIWRRPVVVFSSTESDDERSWRLVINPVSPTTNEPLCLGHILEEHFMPLEEISISGGAPLGRGHSLPIPTPGRRPISPYMQS